jgi:DNA-binding response OmpR family regulator
MMRANVLAIECDWRLRKLVRANLEAAGLEVQEAVDLQHGLRLLFQGRPHLIILDLDIPGTDREQMLRTVSERLGDRFVPIILLSADPLSRDELAVERVVSHLRKPFAAASLLRHVERALDGRTKADRARNVSA